jgi:hypothetical protein
MRKHAPASSDRWGVSAFLLENAMPKHPTKTPGWDEAKAKEQLRVLAALRGETGPDLSPLAYMLGVIRDETADPARRDRMAIAAAPYFHHRVADERIRKKDEAAKAALKAAEGRFAVPPAPQLTVVRNDE